MYTSKEHPQNRDRTLSRQSIDHLTLLPYMYSHSIWAEFCICTALRAIAMSQRPWKVHDPNSKEAVGAGAFNLVRKEFFSIVQKDFHGFVWRLPMISDWDI